MVSHFKSATPAYRIADKKYVDDLTGEGARIEGGRWTPPGCAVLHFAQSLSLCILEKSVWLPRRLITQQLAHIEIILPESMSYEEIKLKDLKKDWRGFDQYDYCRTFGVKWFEAAKTAALKVPSAIIETEYNYLLNPAHKDFKHVKFGKAKSLSLNLKE